MSLTGPMFLLSAMPLLVQPTAAALELPGLPGVDVDQVGIYSTRTYLAFMGAGLGSVALDRLVSPGDTVHLGQVHTGYFAGSDTHIWMLNAGLEKRVAPWFGFAIEANTQQWLQSEQAGVGGGFVTYGRWLALGDRPVRPMVEGGAGVYFGVRPFPVEGTLFTFNLSTRFGVEVDVGEAHRLRVLYGHLHQSNNDIVLPNPGLDVHGFTIALVREL